MLSDVYYNGILKNINSAIKRIYCRIYMKGRRGVRTFTTIDRLTSQIQGQLLVKKSYDSGKKYLMRAKLLAEEFLAELRKSMKTESEDHSGYYIQVIDGGQLTMRISDHHATFLVDAVSAV